MEHCGYEYQDFYHTAGIVPDYMANGCDGQLPVFSVVGRGPKGEGVAIQESAKNDDDCFILEFVSDETGEVVYTTPNLHWGKLNVTQIPSNPIAGQESFLMVSLTRDGESKTYALKIPAGTRGSNVYVCKNQKDKVGNGVYSVSTSELLINGLEPAGQFVPAVGDLCFMKLRTEHEDIIAVGTIVMIGDGSVNVNVRNEHTIPVPWIGENGNWWVNGEDTGVQAQGPKGDRGDDGLTPHIGENGNWFLGDADTGVHAQGPQGEKGDGVEISGSFDDPSDLETVVDPKPGDTYLINGILYVWNGQEWVNNGQLQGPKGDKGDPGQDGIDGQDGKSAYQAAVEGGYTGTEQEFNELLNTLTVEGVVPESIANSEIDEIWGQSDTSLPAEGDYVEMTDSEIDKLF